MNLSCLPNGIKLYWLQFAEVGGGGGVYVKGMDMDVTALKRHPYISPGKHSGEHPVGLNGLRDAEVPAQEKAQQRLCGRASVQCVLMKWSIVSSFPPRLPTHTCSHKPTSLDTPNHLEIVCLP